MRDPRDPILAPLDVATSRTLIIGGPRTGKSTLAKTLATRHGLRGNSESNDGKGAYGWGLPVRSSDELLGKLDWSEGSAEVATWMDHAGPWILEGVRVSHALRKWLRAHPEGKPADQVLVLTAPYEHQTPGQASMSKAIGTVWREVLPELMRRGVEIRTFT